MESNQADSNSVVQQAQIEVESDFNNRYGWFLVVKQVADFTNTTFFNVMDLNIMESLFIASLLKEQVELIQSKTP